MAGDILYIAYTFFLIGFIVIALILLFKWKKQLIKIYLFISIPIVFLFLCYFWNLEFNDYVKSYVFTSTSFECDDGSDRKGSTTIPLPKRTVLHGKQDVCSPFYSTYISDAYFLDFYQGELNTMKNEGEIQNYSYFAQKNLKGFNIDLSSGNQVDIFIHRIDQNKGLITVEFKRNN
ncbi:MAG TPA: hypothetical protein VEV44_04315 [Pseudoneobacillus sp.]|nr:hypothetical protein [Pseudoneobacillus sp.]